MKLIAEQARMFEGYFSSMQRAITFLPKYVAERVRENESGRLDRRSAWQAASRECGELLVEHEAGYEIQLPNLVATRSHAPIVVPARLPSLSEQAQQIVQTSLQASDKLLAEGHGRQAVQEILWLLETVATAFRGVSTADGTVQGSYFNKIVADLRAMGRGKSLEQILGWMMMLHGYLSAPKGGGVRHGIDLKEGVAIDPTEARLYCNLIRSYIIFLIMEHERLEARKGDA